LTIRTIPPRCGDLGSVSALVQAMKNEARRGAYQKIDTALPTRTCSSRRTRVRSSKQLGLAQTRGMEYEEEQSA
jgi:hypothetical protein